MIRFLPSGCGEVTPPMSHDLWQYLHSWSVSISSWKRCATSCSAILVFSIDVFLKWSEWWWLENSGMNNNLRSLLSRSCRWFRQSDSEVCLQKVEVVLIGGATGCSFFRGLLAMRCFVLFHVRIWNKNLYQMNERRNQDVTRREIGSKNIFFL